MADEEAMATIASDGLASFGVSMCMPYMDWMETMDVELEDDLGFFEVLTYSTPSFSMARRAGLRRGGEETADAELALRRKIRPVPFASFPMTAPGFFKVPQAAATSAIALGSLSPVVELAPFLRQ